MQLVEVLPRVLLAPLHEGCDQGVDQTRVLVLKDRRGCLGFRT